MKMVLLGSGGYHPNERRHTSCLMFPEQGLVLDAGTGAFRIANAAQTTSLSIFLTHAHLDHVCGLTYLYVPLALKRLESVRVYARSRDIAAIQDHLYSQPLFPAPVQFEFHELPDSGEVKLNAEIVVRFQPLPSHPGGSTAYRIDGPNGSLASITDTSTDGSYEDFIRGAEILLHECYFPDQLAEYAAPSGHSSLSQVARVAARTDVGRLILTHLDPNIQSDEEFELDQARRLFPACELGYDMLELDLASG